VCSWPSLCKKVLVYVYGPISTSLWVHTRALRRLIFLARNRPALKRPATAPPRNSIQCGNPHRRFWEITNKEYINYNNIRELFVVVEARILIFLRMIYFQPYTRTQKVEHICYPTPRGHLKLSLPNSLKCLWRVCLDWPKKFELVCNLVLITLPVTYSCTSYVLIYQASVVWNHCCVLFALHNLTSPLNVWQMKFTIVCMINIES
jgi:hypothetical protein